MVDIINTIVNYIGQVSPVMIYVILFLIAYFENIVPPIPGDIIVAFGGYLISFGSINSLSLWLGTVIMSVLGFMTMYQMGSFLAGPLLISTNMTIQKGNGLDNYYSDGSTNTAKNALAKLILRFANPSYLQEGRQWMHSYGQWVVVSNRFLAGTRSIIALIAGASKLSIWPTVFSSVISSMLWNGVLVYAGWWLGDNWRRVGVYLEVYSQVIFILLAFIGLMSFVYLRRKRQN